MKEQYILLGLLMLFQCTSPPLECTVYFVIREEKHYINE